MSSGSKNNDTGEKSHWPEMEAMGGMTSEKKDPKPLQRKRAVTGEKWSYGQPQEVGKRGAG